MRRSSRLAWHMVCAALLLSVTSRARADVVTDANARAAEIASRHPATPVAVRMMAIVQVSVFEAVNAITGRYPAFRIQLPPAPDAAVDAAVAAATRAALLPLMPAEKAAIEADAQALLQGVPEDPAKAQGMAVGERAAAAVLAMCADDGATRTVAYRPQAKPGGYVPTTTPLAPHWGKRRPWVMQRADQFRPGPPPALSSEAWHRDYDEIKAVGGTSSTQRTAEQTAMAKFWETTSPAVYWPVVRAVCDMPGRDTADNARLLAVAAMAMDDALIAVFDAKYAYDFWRPITAIRNGYDGDDPKSRDPEWTPFIETPLHPEYPCAHCIVSASLATVLESELDGAPCPTLSSTSPTAPGVVRTWATPAEFAREVSLARIYDGVHYRNSTVVGAQMGAKIGQLAAKTMRARAD